MPLGCPLLVIVPDDGSRSPTLFPFLSFLEIVRSSYPPNHHSQCCMFFLTDSFPDCEPYGIHTTSACCRESFDIYRLDCDRYIDLLGER
jgi:hypothetical protein